MNLKWTHFTLIIMPTGCGWIRKQRSKHLRKMNTGVELYQNLLLVSNNKLICLPGSEIYALHIF